MNQYPLITYISILSTIIPVSVGITKISIFHRAMKILFIYLLFALAADVFLMWFAKGRQFQIGFIHFYFIIEYIFIMSILFLLQEINSMKRIFQTLLLLYIIFWIIAKITFEPLSGLYSITATTSQVILSLGAGYTLFIALGNREQSLKINYRFWVLLSFVIYYAGNLLTIALRGILIQYSLEKLFLVASIDWSLKIIFNVLFAIGFLCPQTQ